MAEPVAAEDERVAANDERMVAVDEKLIRRTEEWRRSDAPREHEHSLA